MGRRFAAVVAISLSMPAVAHAFTAKDGQARAPEFGRLDRARVADPARQAALTAGPAWRRFQAQYGSHWRVTWDDRAGTPRAILGGTIHVATPGANATQVEAAARTFLDSIGYLSGVTDAQLKTSVVEKAGNTWYVRFDRVLANGDAVAGAVAEVRIVNGNVVFVRLETHPDAGKSLPAAKLDRVAAIAKANAVLSPWTKTHSLASNATRVVVPIAAGNGWVYRPAYVVESVGGPSERFRQTVDGVYGEVLARESLVRFAISGTITGNAETRTIGDPLVAQALPYVTAVVDSVTTPTDVAGAYTSAASNPASVTVTLSGQFVRVNNDGGADLSQTFTASAATGNVSTLSGADDDEIAQIAGYRHAATAREWALSVAPSESWLMQQLPVNVNINQQCNAFWDGDSLNMFDEGSQCNNTARVADIVYHEFGHGFHQNVSLGGTDGSIGEGSGDFLAATITGSPTVGPGFMKNGGEVREIEPNHVYPDDIVGESHEDGLIWAGAMWDLRKSLITKYGETTGRATVDGIFYRALISGPSLDTAYDDVLLADDDDGNLANGTPNKCEIDDAFGLHGLTGSGVGVLSHVEVAGPITAGDAIPVTLTKQDTSGVCAGSSVTAATLRYKIDDGAAQSVSLTLSGDEFTGAIPAQAAGSVVRYWFEGQLEGGTTVTSPPKAPENVFAFYVGPLFTVWSDDFESDKGWAHGGTQDDWEIDVPNGAGGDPAAAYSGTRAFGNRIGTTGEYQPGANNFAESPVIDCRGCSGARLQMRRWLTVEDATFDHARVLVNGTVVYANPVGAGNGGALPKDPHWSFQDYDISDIADGENVTIRFELSSDEGAEYGGWTLDDVSIVTPGEPGAPATNDDGLFGCACDVSSRSTTPLAGSVAVALAALGLVIGRRKR